MTPRSPRDPALLTNIAESTHQPSVPAPSTALLAVTARRSPIDSQPSGGHQAPPQSLPASSPWRRPASATSPGDNCDLGLTCCGVCTYHAAMSTPNRQRSNWTNGAHPPPGGSWHWGGLFRKAPVGVAPTSSPRARASLVAAFPRDGYRCLPQGHALDPRVAWESSSSLSVPGVGDTCLCRVMGTQPDARRSFLLPCIQGVAGSSPARGTGQSSRRCSYPCQGCRSEIGHGVAAPVRGRAEQPHVVEDAFQVQGPGRGATAWPQGAVTRHGQYGEPSRGVRSLASKAGRREGEHRARRQSGPRHGQRMQPGERQEGQDSAITRGQKVVVGGGRPPVLHG